MAKRNVILKRILLTVLISVVVIIVLSSVGFYFIWQSEHIDKAKLASLNQTATFYDSDNQVIETAHTKKYTTLANISPDCVNAFIAVEDKNFYQHHGLSYPRIVKALMNNVMAGYSKEGASTITQQLIKNTHLTNEKTLQRKIREAVLALKLEQYYTKEEIMELYLNAIYFGNNLYGIASASEFYFNKTPAELSIAEGAGLAGIIKNPSKYNPLTNHENFVKRAQLVLKLMHEQNLITDQQYQDALLDPLTISTPTDLWLGATYQSAALKEASQILNLSESDIVNYGYQIETYYQADKQKLVYDAINEPEYALPGEKFVMLATPNGQVSALWASTPTLLNARRNFGSAMKPLLVYAPALELGVIQPATKIDDSPLIDTSFNPRNPGGKYHGLVTARAALAQSLNVPAVKIMNATTIPKATEIANKFGLDLADENISMALGNTNKGVTFLELAGAYQTIANGGKYAPARFVRTIRDRNGNTIYFDTSSKYNYAPQAITADTAYLLTDMMLETTRTGTGRKLSYLKTDIASKTGTTERENAQTNTDATFVSFTPQNVLITWHGNATMKVADDLPRGINGGGKLGNVAKQIHATISDPAVHFTPPHSVQTVRLDALDYQAGDLRLASATTPEHETVTDLFASKYLPTEISQNYLVTTPPVIDGKLGDNDTPQIWFNTLKHQTYEIYKNDVLQEVISNKTGEYCFTDKSPKLHNVYRVDASLNGANPTSSNQITIRLTEPTRTKPVERKKVPWYF